MPVSEFLVVPITGCNFFRKFHENHEKNREKKINRQFFQAFPMRINMNSANNAKNDVIYLMRKTVFNSVPLQ